MENSCCPELELDQETEIEEGYFPDQPPVNLVLVLPQSESAEPVVVVVEDPDRQQRVGKEEAVPLPLLVMTPLTCREAGPSYAVYGELRALHQD